MVLKANLPDRNGILPLNFNDVVSGRGILTQDLFGILLQQSQVIGQGQRVYGEWRQTHGGFINSTRWTDRAVLANGNMMINSNR